MSGTSSSAAATFACGMPTPWTPHHAYGLVPIAQLTPTCDHCFCLGLETLEAEMQGGKGTHLKCCKCSTFMAEKFVEAWFKVLAAARPDP